MDGVREFMDKNRGLSLGVLGVIVVVKEFPRGLAVVACLAIAVVAAWYGALRRGVARVAGLYIAGIAAAGAIVLIVVGGKFGVDLLVLAGVLLTLAATRAAFLARAELPRAAAPQRAVLFYNPRSGGGKAERFALAEEARRRGIEPIELEPGEDLETLVRDAVARGADGLAMAGGDGSQAIVAAIAAEHSLPYACVPAGTREWAALRVVDAAEGASRVPLSSSVNSAHRWEAGGIPSRRRIARRRYLVGARGDSTGGFERP